jgi:hypothetical protein
MNRRLLVCLVIGSGLVCGAFCLDPTFAQDKDSRSSESGDSRGRYDGTGASAERVDKALQDYQSRLGQDVEQSRKDIDRMRKELRDLIDTRFDMVLSLAELRADMGVPVAAPGAPAPPGTVIPEPGVVYAGPKTMSETDRQHQRAAILHQELRQIQDVVRNDLQQARSQTDQLVAQLRTLRAQQRQQQQMRSREEEQRKQSRDSKTGTAGSAGSPSRASR